ncbi:HNH endonuclease [Tannerella forsythia]|uniref:HNH endonuclease n=1 Tax=Tannerella forsythia TaxID=28112 RepID=UPI0009BD368E|nr:HNH endonuclease [Tannerella forsythia]
MKSLGNLAGKAGTWMYRNSAVNLLANPQDFLAAQQENRAMLETLADKAANMSAEEWGDFAGQVLFEVGTEVATAGGATALTAVKVADKVVDVAKVANRVDDVLDAAKALDKIDDAADIAKAADKLDDAADAAKALDKAKVPKLKMPVTNARKKGKPLNSPDIDKWKKKGGRVDVLDNGTWRYTDWEGNVVDYVNGYPVFKPKAECEYWKAKRESTTDYTNAIGGSKLDPPKIDGTTWYHHEDGMTMQEVNSDIHDRFTHRGGVYKAKKVALGRKK